MQHVAILVTILAAVGVSRADPRPSDGDFRTAVSTYATKTKRKLVSWGTLHLDATKQTSRFAQLDATDDTPDAAYIVETGAGFVVLTWDEEDDSGFRVGKRDKSGLPVWDALPDNQISHVENHGTNHAKVGIGLRDGKLVALSYSSENHRSDRGTRRKQWAQKDGTCKPGACPELPATATLEGVYLRVSKPAASIDKLVEPPREK